MSMVLRCGCACHLRLERAAQTPATVWKRLATARPAADGEAELPRKPHVVYPNRNLCDTYSVGFVANQLPSARRVEDVGAAHVVLTGGDLCGSWRHGQERHRQAGSEREDCLGHGCYVDR